MNRSAGAGVSSRASVVAAWVLLLLVPGMLITWWEAWDGDPASYGMLSMQLWGALVSHPLHWLAKVFEISKEHAPGLIWVGEFFVPIGRLIGGADVGLLLLNLGWQALTLTAIYFAALNAFESVTAALAATFFAAGTPGFIWMSGHFFQEPMQTAAVASFFWGTTAIGRLDRRRGWVLAGALGTLMMLAKISTPIYVVAPALLLARNLLAARPSSASPPWSRKELVAAAAVAGLSAACLTWYALHLGDNLAYVKAAAVPGPNIYGSAVPPAEKALIWAETLRALFAGRGLWALAALVVTALAFRYSSRPEPRRSGGDALFFACWIQVGIFLFAFSRQYSEEFRYAYPMLVSAALIVGWSASQLPGRVLGTALALLLAVQLNVAIYDAYARPVHQGVGWTAGKLPSAYKLEGVQALVTLACGEGASGLILLGEEKILDTAFLRFQAALRVAPGRGCWIEHVPPGESTAQTAARIRDSWHLYFVSLRPDLLAQEADGPRLRAVLETVRGLGGTKVELPRFPELELYRFP